MRTVPTRFSERMYCDANVTTNSIGAESAGHTFRVRPAYARRIAVMAEGILLRVYEGGKYNKHHDALSRGG